MKKIKKIEIRNFKALYGDINIDLDNGKNLLLYGENGSGKSSVIASLNKFFSETSANANIIDNKNIFNSDTNTEIKVILMETEIYKWNSSENDINKPTILAATKSKGFMDFNELVKIYFLESKKEDEINLFDLFVTGLLKNVLMNNGNKIGESYDNLLQKIPSRNLPKNNEAIEDLVVEFNTNFKFCMVQLEEEVKRILVHFKNNISIKIKFDGLVYNREKKIIEGKKIILGIKYREKDVPLFQNFLNEARLFSIVISIFFASLKSIPSSDLKIVLLDDVLIGMDMINRMAVLKILENEFIDWQIFFTTHDKVWYEIIRKHTEVTKKWKYLEIVSKQNGSEFEIPIMRDSKNYIESSEHYLIEQDYKAAGVYARAYFEQVLKEFSEKNKLKIEYGKNLEKYTQSTFWNIIKEILKKNGDNIIVNEIDVKIGTVLNPLSHDHPINMTQTEVQETITKLEELKIKLEQIETNKKIKEADYKASLKSKIESVYSNAK